MFKFFFERYMENVPHIQIKHYNSSYFLEIYCYRIILRNKIKLNKLKNQVFKIYYFYVLNYIISFLLINRGMNHRYLKLSNNL